MQSKAHGWGNFKVENILPVLDHKALNNFTKTRQYPQDHFTNRIVVPSNKWVKMFYKFTQLPGHFL